MTDSNDPPGKASGGKPDATPRGISKVSTTTMTGSTLQADPANSRHSGASTLVRRCLKPSSGNEDVNESCRPVQILDPLPTRPRVFSSVACQPRPKLRTLNMLELADRLEPREGYKATYGKGPLYVTRRRHSTPVESDLYLTNVEVLAKRSTSKSSTWIPPDLNAPEIEKMTQHWNSEEASVPDNDGLLHGGYRIGQGVQSRMPQRIGFQPLGEKDYGKVVGPGPNSSILVRFKSDGVTLSVNPGDIGPS